MITFALNSWTVKYPQTYVTDIDSKVHRIRARLLYLFESQPAVLSDNSDEQIALTKVPPCNFGIGENSGLGSGRKERSVTKKATALSVDSS